MEMDQIVRGCLKGNRNAQKQFYEHFAPKMFGVCLRYAGDVEMAEDFLQEGFIKVFSNLASFRSEGVIDAWVRRIMVNTALEILRKNDVLKHSSDIDAAFSISDNLPDGFQQLSTAELLKHIQSLPAGFRTVFNLFAIEGYSHQEIAEMLDISEGTSKSQYARAKAWLQKRIGERNL
jgi:RNA polymerase sigma factor (sigma-70 family)